MHYDLVFLEKLLILQHIHIFNFSTDKQRKKTNKEYQMLDLPEKKQYEQEVMKCATGCFDENIATLPKLQERLQNFMKKL
jgi:hypothetical protein